LVLLSLVKTVEKIEKSKDKAQAILTSWNSVRLVRAKGIGKGEREQHKMMKEGKERRGEMA